MSSTSGTAPQAGTDGPIPSDLIRAYAEGRLSWGQLRDRTGVEDFRQVLLALSGAGLRLPRAPRTRPTNARLWLQEALARRRATP